MDLYIVGAGGVGREVLDACIAVGRPVGGFLDDAEVGASIRGLPVKRPADAPTSASYVLAIADPAVRRRLAALLDGMGLTAETVIHPTAQLAPESMVGDGCVLLANVYVSSSVSLGRHVQVHYNATVGHDATVADFGTIYPGANVSGAVQLDEGATVGSNAVVLQGRRVGDHSFVGAGAVVTADVAPGTRVVGSPARALGR